MTIKAGTRTSRLALWQTRFVLDRLRAAWPELATEEVLMVTRGDRILDQPLPAIGGKGLFTAELEGALRDGTIDLAVHSLKDLPTADPAGVVIGAIPQRADTRDVVVGAPIQSLKPGAVVGTSSPRRAAQLLSQRPDLTVRSIRGNVPTRIQKVRDGHYAAAVLAAAGLHRLDLTDQIAEYLPNMLPAPGQGAIAVQCRAGDDEVQTLLEAIHDPPVAATVTAERQFLARLQAGCSSPVGALAVWKGETLELTGLVCSLDGTQQIRVQGAGEPHTLGVRLAEEALAKGAAELIDG